MELWESRAKALSHLDATRSPWFATLRLLFEAIDDCVDAYQAYAQNSTYARICGLTLLKAKNLAAGALSLILDGLGQEAGALMRPFIEYLELLTFFNKFPAMVEQAPEGKLPSAGERAKAIEGMYQEFREHLNLHASHSSYSVHALSHLIDDPSTMRFRKVQSMVPHVLERNLQNLTIQLWMLLHEGVCSLERVPGDQFQRMAQITESLHEELQKNLAGLQPN